MTQLAISNEQKFWTDAQLSALKSLGLSQATQGDLAFFFHQAQRTGLDPFARQIYMIERGGRFGIQTSIDGLRIVAQRSGEYGGQTAPYWCGEDGVWKDVWLGKTAPFAAKVGVYRAGFAEPTWAVARLDSYCPMARDGKPMGLWQKMPDVMLAKCAEALALRKAFPNDLSGIYTDDEMSQADVVTVVEAPKPKPQKVDLAIVANTTPDKDIDWIALVSSIMSAKTKDELKGIWIDNAKILDVQIPAEQSNGATKQTLRELFLERIETFDA